MPKRAFKFYQRKRVVNINLNILAAGFIAIALAFFPVKLIGDWIGTERTLTISAITYVIETIFDVLVYYALHWMANHWNPHGHLPKDDQLPKARNFIQDSTRIQAERMALVPIYILIGPIGMWLLQERAGVHHTWAFLIAFPAAMITTRVIHTFWGYRSGTFKNHLDFIIDDGIQIGRDLSAEAQAAEAKTKAEAAEQSEPTPTDKAAH